MTRALAFAVVLVLAPAVAAQPARPPALRAVGVDEHAGMKVPLDLAFTDAAGRRVPLGDVFDGKPVVLVLAYMRCKMLCSLVLHATTEAVRAMPLELGRDYRLVTVSIDPSDDAATAAARRDTLLARAGHAGEPERWTFLVGAERPIRALADSLGFRYAWDPQTEQFAHPAVVFVIAPDGTIARYLQGVQLDPRELAAAVREAAAGHLAKSSINSLASPPLPLLRTGSITETVLSCFHFDPSGRAHRAAIRRYLQLGGAAIVVMLVASILTLVLWERRRGRRS